MKYYSVKEIANLISVNEETVRRWIREGKLKSTIISKKTGNSIKESDLYEFLNTIPRYRLLFEIKEPKIDEIYNGKLHELLDELILERDKINDYISKIEKLLKGS